MGFYKNRIKLLLEPTSIEVNGSQPHDLQVHNAEFYRRVYWHGSLGLGESYMDGWWDTERLDTFFTELLGSDLSAGSFLTHHEVWLGLKSVLFNMQKKYRASSVAEQHYDLHNEFYADMLDDNMQYTCAYWKRADSLAEAQEDEMRMLCEKMNLDEADNAVEFGGGWGYLAHYAAEHYDVEVDVYNISEEQVRWARQHNDHPNVSYHLQDYREAKGSYDACYSIGFFEAVGPKNYDKHFDLVHDLLADDGIALVQTIGSNFSVPCTDVWYDKYIFPNGVIPSAKQITKAAEDKLIIEDWHNYGPDYDKTLMAWHDNFQSMWEEWKDTFDERFKRMWEYYLLSSAAAFRCRRLQNWDIVFSKGDRDDYTSIR